MVDLRFLGSVRAYQVVLAELVSLLRFNLLPTHLFRLSNTEAILKERKGFVDGETLYRMIGSVTATDTCSQQDV